MQEPARGLAQADDKGRARATAPRLPMTRSARAGCVLQLLQMQSTPHDNSKTNFTHGAGSGNGLHVDGRSFLGAAGERYGT
jgi:hypothetical protein